MFHSKRPASRGGNHFLPFYFRVQNPTESRVLLFFPNSGILLMDCACCLPLQALDNSFDYRYRLEILGGREASQLHNLTTFLF